VAASKGNNVSDHPSIGIVDHFAINTRLLDKTVQFYETVLGLENGPRPNFSFPGAWLYSEGRAIVHLVDVSAEKSEQTIGTGALHHVAFASRGFDVMRDRLLRHGISFDAREKTADGVKRIFVTDPNGVMLELNYPGR
jgi:catechol 2,3-dioxygenase-like lactoylglutathione lyase family enzyme